MKIQPDTDNEIRVVPLVNLQGNYAVYDHEITIDELRSVLSALWPQCPERFEFLPGLIAVLGQLGVALESKADRVWRIERIQRHAKPDKPKEVA